MTEAASDTRERFESWAVLELFGHTRLAGRVTEQTIGGCSFIRLDVPEQKYVESRGVDDAPGGYAYIPHEITLPAYTKFLTQGAIYCMTPCSEAVARKAMEALRTPPISHIDLAEVKVLPAPPSNDPVDGEGDAIVTGSHNEDSEPF